MITMTSRGKRRGSNWFRDDLCSSGSEIARDKIDSRVVIRNPPPAGTCSCITSDVEYTDEQRQFLRAMEEYKKVNRRQFPAYTEVLAVLASLGYRQVAQVIALPKFKRTVTPTVRREV